MSSPYSYSNSTDTWMRRVKVHIRIYNGVVPGLSPSSPPVSAQSITRIHSWEFQDMSDVRINLNGKAKAIGPTAARKAHRVLPQHYTRDGAQEF